MDDAQKLSIAQEQAQKKAARRAAFIQEVAQAVALLVVGESSTEPKPEPVPFARAFRRWERDERRARDIADEEQEVLSWARQRGLVPVTTTELPSIEMQKALLDAHNRLIATAQSGHGLKGLFIAT